MKLSNFIKKLQKLQEKYGADIEVIYSMGVHYEDESAPNPKVIRPKTNPKVKIL